MTVASMSKKEFDRLEVLLGVRSGRLRVADGCELLGLKRRQVFRLLAGLKHGGAASLISKRRGRPSNNRLPEAYRDLALSLVRERYADETVQNLGGAMPAAGGCGAGTRCGGGSCWSWPGLMARRSGTRSAQASASQPGIPQRRWASAWRRAKRSWPRYSAISSRRRWMSTAAAGAVATGAGHSVRSRAGGPGV